MEAGKASNHILIEKVLVTAANGNQEAQGYAMQFVKMFKAAGCESDLNLPIPGLRPDVTSVHIGIRDSKNIPEGALALVQLHTKRYPLLCGGLRWLAQSHDFCDGLGSPVERASVLIPLFNKEIDLFPKVLD